MVKQATILVAAASVFLTLVVVLTNSFANEPAREHWHAAAAKAVALLMASRAGF